MSKHSCPAPTGPSLEQWRTLYEVAGNLKKLAPWRALADMDILILQLPGRSEPVYCSVMGQGGESYGVSVYPGNESLARLQRILDRDACNQALLILEQSCLVCSFGDREEIEPQDRAVMKQLDLRFRGRSQWIYFRSMKPGQFPWFLDAQEAELLTSALQNLFMLCRWYMEGRIHADFDAGETLRRWYDPESELWLNAVAPMRWPKLDRTLDLQDDLLLARLKRGKKTAARLEADSFYIPLPIRRDPQSPPVGAYMALLVDRDSGLVVDQQIAGPDQPDYVVAPSMLVDYMQAYGRPAAVYVRSGWLGSLLRSTCGALGVRLVEDEGVPALDRLLEEMMGPLMTGMPMDGDFGDLE